MAADVDICNLALGYLGDEANIASINPPDQSAQASHCSRFYPQVRDELLEMHAWQFATTRAVLASVANPTTDPTTTTNPNSAWQYAYAAPANVLKYLAVLDPSTTDDYSTQIPYAYGIVQAFPPGIGIDSPQPFVVETDANGNAIILTNMQNAELRYTQSITDTTKFSPSFVEALARLLAAKLAGPLLKGEVGRQEGQAQMQWFEQAFGKAVKSDSNSRRIMLEHGPAWMVNR